MHGVHEGVLLGSAQIRKRKQVKIGQKEELDCEAATTRPQPNPGELQSWEHPSELS